MNLNWAKNRALMYNSTGSGDLARDVLIALTGVNPFSLKVGLPVDVAICYFCKRPSSELSMPVPQPYCRHCYPKFLALNNFRKQDYLKFIYPDALWISHLVMNNVQPENFYDHSKL